MVETNYQLLPPPPMVLRYHKAAEHILLQAKATADGPIILQGIRPFLVPRIGLFAANPLRLSTTFWSFSSNSWSPSKRAKTAKRSVRFARRMRWQKSGDLSPKCQTSMLLAHELHLLRLPLHCQQLKESNQSPPIIRFQ